MSKINLSSTVSELFFTKPNYERNITDIKDIYLNHLVRLLSPCMFDSIKLIYNKSTQIANGDMTVEYAFKVCLKDLVNLSSTSIIKEVAKIKQLSNSAGYFDNLIKSVIKSFIVLMSYNVSKETCPICNMSNYNIDTNQFIHKCYIELGNIIFNDPRIFILCLKDGDNLNNVDGVIRAGNRFDKMVKRCICRVIFDFIPVNDILVEYLNKEKITDENIKARQELEKEEIINQIVNGCCDKLNSLFNENKETFINEIINRLQSFINVKPMNNQIDNPININQQNSIIDNLEQNEVIKNAISNTLTNEQINNVIRNDIPNENISKEEIINDDNNEDNEEENKVEITDGGSDSENNNNVINNLLSSESEQSESDELLLNTDKIDKAGEEEQQGGEDNELNEEIKAINENKEEEQQQEEQDNKDEEKQEEEQQQIKRRGRPKKFITTNNNKISLNKFKQ